MQYDLGIQCGHMDERIGSALISILLFSAVLFAFSSLALYLVLRNTTNHSTLSRMADPSKPDSELQRTENKSKDSAQSDIPTVPTVPAEPETPVSPRPSGPYLDDETRELFGFNSNAEELRLEETEAERLAFVQRAAQEAAKRRVEALENKYNPNLFPKPHPKPDPLPESPHSYASIIMNGFPEVRRREEDELLRRREEVTAREEKLQQAATVRRILDATQPTAPKDTIDWNEVAADEKALRNSETKRGNPKLQPPPLFRKRVHSWFQRYAGWAFVGASMGLAGLAEYAVAIALLVVAFVAFAIQIHAWSGNIQRRWLVALVKGFWCLGVIGMLLFFGAAFFKMKGSKPWSNLLARNEAEPSQSQPTPTPPVALIRHSGSTFFATYPQPFMYELGDDSLVPIALDLAIAITNNRGTATRITEYTAEIQTRDGAWHRLISLPMSPPRTIFFLNRFDIRRGMKCRLEPPAFDAVADRREIGAGETIEGQMFFELPAELRYETVSYGKLKVTTTNIQGETSVGVFDNPGTPSSTGAGQINGGFTWCPGEPNQAIDLSRKLIRPLRE